jgi:hypothetical protein
MSVSMMSVTAGFGVSPFAPPPASTAVWAVGTVVGVVGIVMAVLGSAGFVRPEGQSANRGWM